MHDQSHRYFERIFACPAYDEFLRIMIEVLLVKRRRIHRVKELLDVLQLQFDGIARI